MERKASANWKGGLKGGVGKISTGSGALSDTSYGFAARFADGKGTNPEELLGAAHAGCFTMALSLMLEEAGMTAQNIDTTAKVTFGPIPGGFEISAIHLSVEANIPGADAAKFAELAAQAKSGCPVSKALRPEITLDAKLVN